MQSPASLPSSVSPEGSNSRYDSGLDEDSVVNLDNQGLTEIPNRNVFRKAQKVIVTNNRLHHFPGTFFPKCKQLYAASNDISSVIGITSMANTLTFLDLSSNSLAAIDQRINQFSKLQALTLSANQLKELPRLKLPSLSVLDVSLNALAAMPDISDCRQLLEVSLAGNHIQTLENSLPILPPSLRVLDLSGNPISDISQLVFLHGNGMELPDLTLTYLSVENCSFLRGEQLTFDYRALLICLQGSLRNIDQVPVDDVERMKGEQLLLSGKVTGKRRGFEPGQPGAHEKLVAVLEKAAPANFSSPSLKKYVSARESTAFPPQSADSSSIYTPVRPSSRLSRLNTPQSGKGSIVSRGGGGVMTPRSELGSASEAEAELSVHSPFADWTRRYNEKKNRRPGMVIREEIYDGDSSPRDMPSPRRHWSNSANISLTTTPQKETPILRPSPTPPRPAPRTSIERANQNQQKSPNISTSPEGDGPSSDEAAAVIDSDRTADNRTLSQVSSVTLTGNDENDSITDRTTPIIGDRPIGNGDVTLGIEPEVADKEEKKLPVEEPDMQPDVNETAHQLEMSTIQEEHERDDDSETASRRTTPVGAMSDTPVVVERLFNNNGLNDSQQDMTPRPRSRDMSEVFRLFDQQSLLIARLTDRLADNTEETARMRDQLAADRRENMEEVARLREQLAGERRDSRLRELEMQRLLEAHGNTIQAQTVEIQSMRIELGRIRELSAGPVDRRGERGKAERQGNGEEPRFLPTPSQLTMKECSDRSSIVVKWEHQTWKGFNIIVDDVIAGTVAGTATSAKITDLERDEEHTVQMQSIAPDGSLGPLSKLLVVLARSERRQ